MARKIRDSVVVITGASGGIGRSTALVLARHGAAVVLAARRQEPLHELAAECEERGGKALAVPTDVTDEEAVHRLARQAVDRFGRIDTWVNNAAVTLFGRIEETPYDAYRRVIETNLFGYIHGARAVIPYFRGQRSGTLINVASVAGKVGQPYTSAYCSSKFGIVGLSECLRQELMDIPDIHVCTILPASIDTPIFQHAANYTGRAVKPMSPVYDPELVSDAIVRCIEHPVREVVVGGSGKRLLMVRNLLPGWSERQMASKVDRDHFQHRRAEPTPGNLFEPMPGLLSAHGGWKPQGISWATVGLAALGVGLLAWWMGASEAEDEPAAGLIDI